MSERPSAERPACVRPVIALIGNPNAGKTTLFNALTGEQQTVGNWPGVTVSRREGIISTPQGDLTLIDLPGTYALGGAESSADQAIAQDFIRSSAADVVINIADAANLERNLYLTLQLQELGVPVVLALNMMDVARSQDVVIDVPALAAGLGIPVIPIVAARREGIDALRGAILQTLAVGSRGHAEEGPETRWLSAPLRAAVEQIAAVLSPESEGFSRRYRALQLLEEGADARGDRLAPEAEQRIHQIREQVEADLGEDLDIALADARYGAIAALAERTIRRGKRLSETWTGRIDHFVLNKYVGVPLFLGVMYLMFVWTIHVGGAFIDFFDILAGGFLVDGSKAALAALGAPAWLGVAVGDGIGGGLQTIATFVPIIAALYLFMSILEDVGYLPRAAFVLDRFMRNAGLPGHAFIPLLVGFGCNVPAIMATRTLENEADRKAAIMMSPFMSCGARLPVYVLFAAAFFPMSGQNLVFALYIMGILVAVLTGLVLKATVLDRRLSPLILEMPPYHWPTVRNILQRTWHRLSSFLFRAGKVIVAMVFVLAVLNSVGQDGSLGNEDTDRSLLAGVARTLTPVFAPMGIEEDNWPAVVGILTGLFAKEAVVGSLDALYGGLAETEAGSTAVGDAETAMSFAPGSVISEAFAATWANLQGLGAALVDPLGLDLGPVGTTAEASATLQVEAGVFGAMAARFDGQAGAFAYLLFILLYFPCVAALGAVYQELDARWTAFAAIWTTSVAYFTATGFYQLSLALQTQGVVMPALILFGVFSALAAWLAGRRFGGPVADGVGK